MFAALAGWREGPPADSKVRVRDRDAVSRCPDLLLAAVGTGLTFCVHVNSRVESIECGLIRVGLGVYHGLFSGGPWLTGVSGCAVRFYSSLFRPSQWWTIRHPFRPEYILHCVL